MNATVEQFATLNAHITRALPKAIGGLGIEEIIRYAEADDDGKLSALLRTALMSLTGQSEPQPEAAPVPEVSVLTVEVVAEFTLGNEKFDAVRIKWTGETAPSVEEGIKAADTDGHPVVRTEEEWSRAYKHRHGLPTELNGFWLITARPDPGDPRSVSGLDRGSREWYGLWDSLGGELSDDDLVLRRRT